MKKLTLILITFCLAALCGCSSIKTMKNCHVLVKADANDDSWWGCEKP